MSESELYVLQYREGFENIIILKDKGYIFLSVLLPVALYIVRGRLTAHEHLALLVRVHSAEDVEKGGLTASRRSGHGNKFAYVHFCVDASYTDGDAVFRDVYLSYVLEFYK